ncbi:MAG: hypothetical protein JWR42_41 [Marmoricola sp.]|nr:hypothetical protein [Marmoricola sp.]
MTDTSGGVVVGIDIGGTGTRFVALDPTTRTVVARASAVTPPDGAPEQVASFLRSTVVALVAGRPLLGVGIGASGPIDAHGVIQNPDTLPAFTGLPLPQVFEGMGAPRPVIDNDAVAAALGERAVGAAVGAERSLHVTLGTGIGVCLLQGEVPFRYPDGSHPEAGHLTVATRTRPCYCGRRSCWEQAASRRALQRAAARRLDRPSDDRDVLGDLAAMTLAGDEAAGAVFVAYGYAVAEGLSSVITAYGPDLVVLGGSAAAYLDLFRGPIDTELARLSPWVPRTTLVASTLDDFGGAVGAAISVLHQPPVA